MARKITITATVSILLMMLAIEFYGIYLLRRHNSFVRFVYAKNLNSLKTNFIENGLGELALKFRSKDPLVLLEQVMNSVNKIETRPRYDALSVYRDSLKGKGTLCGGMASLYFSVLRLNGINARIVLLTRNLYDIYDTHTTVEVLINNRWVIFDPSFNVSFEKEGKLIGSQEIKESLCDGSLYKIKPVFYGNVAYPARIENYYIYWLPFFNNVFIINNQNYSVWHKVPPFRYWFGPKYYYYTKFKDYQLEFHDRIIFLFVVIIPVIIYILASILVLIIIKTIMTQLRENKYRSAKR